MDISEQRKILYELEGLGITKIDKKKVKQATYEYKWAFTKKGQKIIDENEPLKFLWKTRKLKEFYEEIKKLLKKE